MAKDNETLQREISQLAEDVLVATGQSVEATVFALYRLGRYLSIAYPYSLEKIQSELGKLKFSDLASENENDYTEAQTIGAAIIGEVSTAYIKYIEERGAKDIFAALTCAQYCLPLIFNYHPTIVDDNRLSDVQLEKIKKMDERSDQAILAFDRLCFVSPSTKILLDKKLLKTSSNPVIKRIVENNNIIPSAANPNIDKDLHRNLLVLNDVSQEEISTHYNQELASIYSEALRKNFESSIGSNGSAKVDDAQVIMSKEKNGDIVAVVKSAAGYASELDADYKKITTALPGTVIINYRLSKKRPAIAGKFEPGFELESIEVSNSQLAKVVMTEKSDIPFHEVKRSAEIEESKETRPYRYLVASCINDAANAIHPSEELKDFAKILLNVKEKPGFPEPSQLLKAKAGYLFSGTRRYWLAPKRHRIYQALASIPETSAVNYGQATLSAYTRIVSEALDLHLVNGETLEAYLDRARIVQNDRKQSLTIIAGADGLSIENLKRAKTVLEDPKNAIIFSEKALKDRLNHLIKYSQPLTLDKNGIYAFGNFSSTVEKYENDFFNEKGKFDYRKYTKQCEIISKSLINSIENLDGAQKQQINGIVCRSLLDIQNRILPAYAPLVADAYAKELSGVASESDREYIKLAQSTSPGHQDAKGSRVTRGGFFDNGRKARPKDQLNHLFNINP